MYFSFGSGVRWERNGRKARGDETFISDSAVLASWKPISTLELTFKDLCPSLFETLGRVSLQYSSGSDTLLTNNSLLLGSLGELHVFPSLSPFLPISSCSALPLPRSSHFRLSPQTLNEPLPGAQAIPSPRLSWNWNKNGTNNKAELWFISKLRVEKGKSTSWVFLRFRVLQLW